MEQKQTSHLTRDSRDLLRNLLNETVQYLRDRFPQSRVALRPEEGEDKFNALTAR
jgi:hypothetical protein